FINLLQTMIETLLFYHPAVWWISRQIRNEREQACDDLVVAKLGKPVVYARALTKIEHLRSASQQFVVAASGGNLLQRIGRMFEFSLAYRQPSTLMMFSIILTTVATLFFGLWIVLPNRNSDIISSAKAATLKIAVGNEKNGLPNSSQELSDQIAYLV